MSIDTNKHVKKEKKTNYEDKHLDRTSKNDKNVTKEKQNENGSNSMLMNTSQIILFLSNINFEFLYMYLFDNLQGIRSIIFHTKKKKSSGYHFYK